MGMTHEVKRAVKGGCSRLKKQAPGSKVCAWWSQETRGNKPMDGNENLPGVSGRQEQSNLGQRKG